MYCPTGSTLDQLKAAARAGDADSRTPYVKPGFYSHLVEL